MSCNERVVVQITITVGGDGKACVKLDPPVGGTSTGSAGVVPVGDCGAAGSTVATGGAPVGTGGGTVVTGGGGAATGGPSATCVAQRTVHLVAGNGGLAWFTLIWPAPEVITIDNSAFAYDDRATAGLVPGTATEHPLYARKIGTRVVWDGNGKHGQPSVFVAGMNQTHTGTPQTTTVAGGPEVIAAGAAVQAGLGAPLPVLIFKEGLHYGPAPGAPAAALVANVGAAINALRAVTPVSPALEQDLLPAPAKLATWGINVGSTPQILADLASNLLFTANAFRLGLVSTVLLPAFNDDPHGAFAGGDAAAALRANALARILDGFYAELALHVEPKCSTVGTPLSLADNVVLVVSGDTPKTSFNRNGWGDGTVGQANLLYVRSNGYLKPGWFGGLSLNGRTNFDPTTGAPSATTLAAISTTAAQLGVLFAITRGNVAAVAQASSAPYGGVLATTLP